MMPLPSLIGLLTWILLKAMVLRGDLVINARNQGGELVTEVLSANVSDDTVILELRKTDGTVVTQLTDFKNSANLLRVIISGEEELGQTSYQVLCFLIRFPVLDVIPPEAMSKLRQKNPGTIRIPEEDKGVLEISLDITLMPELVLGVAEKYALSPHLVPMCSEAVNAVYAREEDVKYWHEQRAVSGFPDEVAAAAGDWNYIRSPGDDVERCRDTYVEDASCSCRLVLSIPWYPCGLKFCSSKDDSGKLTNYRCGIQTCRMSYGFLFRVPRKRFCLWDV